MWTRQENTNVEDGQHSDATTVQDCQAACINNVQCTGVDFIPTNPDDQKCWLSGPWSGARNNGTISGVTHYDIDRSNCPGTTGNISTNP